MGTMVCDNESKKDQPRVLKVEAQSSIIRQYSKNDKVTQKGERTRKGLHARHKKKGDISMKDQSWFIGKQGLIHSLHVRIIQDRIFLFWKPPSSLWSNIRNFLLCHTRARNWDRI
jgi:hypothetical protein